jgi:hypothetical protein
MEQIGEKQDFEAELSRLGLRHEDFALHVRRGGLGGIDRDWGGHYAIRVTNIDTGIRGIYWGGPGENWVAQFVTDVAKGMFHGVLIRGKLPVPVRKSIRRAGGDLT